jgi:EAL domain-containing protein (putative c-di-GMP-specific phosphodiesterase class I)
MGGLYIHAIGAETLKRGQPWDAGWLPAFLLAMIASAAAVTQRSNIHQALIVGGAIVSLLVLPAFLEAELLFVDVAPGLFVLTTIAVSLGYRRIRARGLLNPVSGLPNLSALRTDRSGRDKAVIGARILNYAEIAASLPAEKERQLIEQIVGRLTVGAPERRLFHGDGGIFAWFEEPEQPFGYHLEALYGLFRNPARVDGLTIDVAIAFGVEIGSSRSLANRLASALLAAEEAGHDGLKWKYHDPERLQNASWKLSMLSQLDEAIDRREVWVAFQPKLDLATRKIVGAEALARWTHPDKGPIAASEFIAAAEQHDRIAKLTDFVLTQAIRAAASLHSRDPGFGIAVNLSAKLLSDPGFLLRLTAVLARHRLPASCLTLELTETASLADDGAAVDMLTSLRDLGVTISIDDYGTGLSTLDYLKKIPASEIKIDQSFVKGMLDNRSDRLMVQSTIGLAHSLGRKVVAEGVERRETLDALIEMNCDTAQGFIIGRPMSLESLAKRIGGDRRSQVA